MLYDVLQTVLLPNLIEIVALILASLIARAALYAKRKWNIDIEASQRDALHSAIMSGIRSAILSGANNGQAVKAAVEYAKASVPDAIRSLRPNETVLLDLAASKLQQLTRQ